ncbi:MAG: hypothetical protein HRT52_16760 [Colwellia sp.]|nr:hypothetical protein [Colwellia sp.]
MIKPITLITLALSLLYIVIDFTGRFLIDGQQSNNTMANLTINDQLQLPQLNAVQQLKLTNAYGYYQQDEKKIKVVEKVIGLTDEQKLAQQGELTEFYDGDWRYRLIAIISPDGSEQALKSPMALLSARNVKDTAAKSSQNNNKDAKSKKLTKISHGAKLGLYDVTITNTKQVSFQLKQRKITLLMYKPKNKNA